MDRMPAELRQEVLQHLDKGSLKALRLANKSWASDAASLLFQVLRIYGPDKLKSNRPGPGPPRRVEFGKLHQALPEVAPVAQYVKSLVFAPGYYRQGHWDDYREYLQDQVVNGGPEPIEVMDVEDACQDDKAELERYRRIWAAELAERQARPAKEEPQIVQAEQVWALKRQEQQQNQEVIERALVELLREMILEDLEIRPWVIQQYQGLQFLRGLDDDHRDSSPIQEYVDMLARCLHLSGRRLTKLHLHNYHLEFLQEPYSALAHLRHLRLETRHLGYNPASGSILSTFLQPCRAALEHMEVIYTCRNYQESDGVATLRTLLADETSNLGFPNLRHLYLENLMVDTQALVEFLTAQPRLLSVEFRSVRLMSPLGWGWHALVMALPRTIEYWYASGILYEIFLTPPALPDRRREYKEWSQNTDLSDAGWQGVHTGIRRRRFTRLIKP
ncbi:hypothetical protein B0I35DRAFT_483798 [Stachybotrys elegans]|uniref:F-box domain-containing protein n=1 Tax=Stachybotrys elegans TaxID=80388 RepID=A0A8K0WLF7_9HYPO|nr:hypothetical protein B0I35DRAFT_483798 [Stachybotrys elegans]